MQAVAVELDERRASVLQLLCHVLQLFLSRLEALKSLCQLFGLHRVDARVVALFEVRRPCWRRTLDHPDSRSVAVVP